MAQWLTFVVPWVLGVPNAGHGVHDIERAVEADFTLVSNL